MRRTSIHQLADWPRFKYAALARCSQDTALRDIALLVDRGILVRGPERGRSTSYTLAVDRML